MRPSKRLLTAALPIAALAIAGCGGGGSSSTASTQTTTAETTAAISKTDLIKQGDAICGEVNAAVGSVGTSRAGVAAQTTQVSDLYIGMVKSLERLGAPEDRSGYSELIEKAEMLAKVEGEVKLAAEREDTAALGEAATKATPALEEFQTAAGAYGFEKCGEGPSAPTPSGTGAETGGAEAAEGSPEAIEEEAAPEAEEAAPETGGAGGAPEEAPPAGGGTGAGGGGGESGGSSGGIGPG
jgi:hypothetical protein